jgi:hypothetical protein
LRRGGGLAVGGGAAGGAGGRPEEAGRAGQQVEAGCRIDGVGLGERVEKIRWSGRDDGWVPRVSI